MTQEETNPHRAAMSVVIKSAILVASSKCASDDLLAIVDLIANAVPLQTLIDCDKHLTLLSVKYAKSQSATGLTPIAEINAKEKP